MAEDTHILISGGGVAGLTAACAFGAAGFKVVCVDPMPPVTDRSADGADLRTTAFLAPARALLEDAGIWPHLMPHATPLATMRIVDAGGAAPEARVLRDFESGDIGQPEFGYNLPNTAIREGLLARLAELPNVDFRPGVATEHVLARSEAPRVRLSDGTTLTPHMIIAADGRASPVRKALGIGVRTMRFGQTALTFAVAHDVPHGDVSTEIHRTGGPFTFVPLAPHEGRPCSAIVWMEPDAEAARLLDLDDAAFEAEATTRSAGLFGDLTLVTRRTSWPIISQLADRFYGPRTALIAEAAHVMPPIGAQGLNTSLADITALLQLSKQDPERIGQPVMLRAYHRKRFAEVKTRVLGVSALNRVSMATPQVVRDARAAGIKLLHDVAPVRKGLMRLGMGTLPRRRSDG
ncbi:MAG: FAD-dependent monooxygenase [Shimia sp.]